MKPVTVVSQRLLQPLRRLMRRLQANDQGVAAIEFAFIAPLVFTLFVGAVEVSQAFTVDRRVMQVASTTGDLVARADASITQSEMSDIMAVGSYIMLPYSSTTPRPPSNPGIAPITSAAVAATRAPAPCRPIRCPPD